MGRDSWRAADSARECSLTPVSARACAAEAASSPRRREDARPTVWLRLRRAALYLPLTSAADSTNQINLLQPIESVRDATNLLPTVGMEGRVEVLLSGSALDAKPVEPRSLIVLRIASTRPHGTLIYYDLRYVGLKPGQYDLRKFLVRKNGSALDDLPPIPVEIAKLLPEPHNGILVEQPLRPLPFLGGYKTLMLALAATWLGAFVPLYFSGRRNRKVQPPAALTPAPTFADRLRPLVEQAAQGTLTSDGKAQLERLLLRYWRKRLKLDQVTMSEALARLREHPEAGTLLRQLEDWLHRPPGSVAVDVESLLAPYREHALPESVEVSK